MIDTTQADYNQLETIAGKFGQLADSNTALHSRLAQTSQQLKGGGWAGAGAVAFLNEMEGEIFPALQRLTQA
ncbi:MAG TPA: WXG100 family type VII secretion target, partial [Anaerolineae bacterium]|nr:WXG100 family type VII secretion target [Anaerolineae bacterium]